MGGKGCGVICEFTISEECSIRRLPSSASRPMFAAFNQVVPIKGAAAAPDADELPRTAPPIATPIITETIPAAEPAQPQYAEGATSAIIPRKPPLLDLTLGINGARARTLPRAGRIV